MTTENTGLVYDRLIALDLHAQPTPMLAESWDLSPDYRQIKFKLRSGVQFHTGRELTSDDVRYTFDRIRDPKVGLGQYALQSQWFPTIETPDKYTVVFSSDQPRPTMFDLFEYLNIGDRQTLEGPDAKTKAVGTGAYQFVEWAQGNHIAFERNPNYWQSGVPYLDTVRTSFFTDAQAMVTQFEGGALDLIRTPPTRDYVRLQTDSHYQGISHPIVSNAYGLGANVQSPPTDNKLVRQALNLGDRPGRLRRDAAARGRHRPGSAVVRLFADVRREQAERLRV